MNSGVGMGLRLFLTGMLLFFLSLGVVGRCIDTCCNPIFGMIGMIAGYGLIMISTGCKD